MNDIVRKAIILVALLIVSIGIQAQKPTTTKPSVAELISFANSADRIASFSKLAKSNGYYGIEGVSDYGYRLAYEKKLKNGAPVNLECQLYDDQSFEWLFITSRSKGVVNSWEEQLKRLGYHYDRHEEETGLRGMSLDTWYYSKPGGLRIKIQHSEFGDEYVLTISK